MFDTAEIVPLTIPLTEMASAFAMQTEVVNGLQHVVGAGNPRRACSGRRQTCAPESTTAPGMSPLKPPQDTGMEMRMSRRGCALKDTLAAASTCAALCSTC